MGAAASLSAQPGRRIGASPIERRFRPSARPRGGIGSGFSLRPGITLSGYSVDTKPGMKDALAIDQGRGPDLLLEHCTALTRVDDLRPPAFQRLEHALGGELARFLVVALARRNRERGRLAA